MVYNKLSKLYLISEGSDLVFLWNSLASESKKGVNEWVMLLTAFGNDLASCAADGNLSGYN